jgi:hypothetical protein
MDKHCKEPGWRALLCSFCEKRVRNKDFSLVGLDVHNAKIAVAPADSS